MACRWISAGVAAGLALISCAAHGQGSLMPRPATETSGPGRLRIASGMAVLVPSGDVEARFAADRFARRIGRTTGLVLPVRTGAIGAGPSIVLSLDAASAVAQPDGYTLDVAPTGIRIAARTETGLFYGLASLAQMLDAGRAAPQGTTLPETHLRDWPRFAWRGFMLDSARHMQSIGFIETLIDQMADHKLDVLHWHLTDDQGWRIEIRRYPALTRIGAWRTPPNGSLGSGPRYGGFYTQAQIRRIVAYASARHITVMPEIDMPGHAQALIAAYPQAGVTGTRPPVATDWGVNPYLLGVDDPAAALIRGVLDEVMALFPSPFIHVGGDEAIKDQWRASPAIQARIKALGLKNEDALQSWFIERIGQYLAGHGRRMIGWDEILDGGIPPSASIMSWRGADGAVSAARLGHDSVLSPAPTLYLDGLQSTRDDEPAGRRAYLPLLGLYDYDPLPAGLEAMAPHVLGLQANLFTEYMTDDRHAAWATYPRLDALAEIAWTPQGERDRRDFLRRMPDEMARFRRDAIPAADSAFAIAIDAAPGTPVALSNQTGFGQIRYTLDGSAPTMASTLYAVPFRVAVPARIAAAAFDAQGRMLGTSRSRVIDEASLHTTGSAQLRACPHQALGLRVPLAPDATGWGPVHDVDLFDSCWIDAGALPAAASRVSVALGRLPRTYGLAQDASKVVSHPAATPFGELVLRRGRCDGPADASLPLPDPRTAPTRSTLTARLPPGPAGDLCLLVTAPIDGPFTAVRSVTIRSDRERRP